MDENKEIERKIDAGIYRLVQKRKGISPVWTTFAQILKEDGSILDGYVCCRTCKRILRYNGKQSSNLNRHKCFNLASPGPPKKVSADDKKEAIDVCTTWIIEDCRPFTAVEGTGFRKMVNFILKIGARYGSNIELNDFLPDPSTLSRRITEKAQEKKKEMKSKIAKLVNNGEASVTLDLWQDNYVRRNFLCATLHFPENFELTDIVLGMKSMDFMRSGEQNVHYKLQNLLGEYGIENLNKIVFVTDMGSNVRKSLENYTTLNCSSHLFSNLLDSAVECTGELADVINSCKRIVKYFTKANLQHLLQTSLESYCPARWSSHYAMFKSILDNWKQINDILADNSEIERLSSTSILILQSFVDLCGYFEIILKKLQGCSFPSICFVIPSITRLKEICQNQQTDLQAISALKRNILKQLDETWVSNLSIWHKTAFFLYTPANSEQGSDLDEIKEFCINEIKNYEENDYQIDSKPNSTDVSNPSSPNLKLSPNNSLSEYPTNLPSNANNSLNDDIRFFFPELLNRTMMSAPEKSAREEVSRYCMENILIDEFFDVMQWWKANSAKYPRLSKLALRILSIPASSSASERVFSLAGNITEKHNRLAPKTVDNILFLHSFYKTVSC